MVALCDSNELAINVFENTVSLTANWHVAELIYHITRLGHSLMHCQVMGASVASLHTGHNNTGWLPSFIVQTKHYFAGNISTH